MIRFEDDEEGFPQVAFTRGQKDLIKAALDVGITTFQVRSTESLTTISMKTKPRSDGHMLGISGEWWGAGRFRACYVEELAANGFPGGARQKCSSLADAMKRITAFVAPPKKRAKKSA